MKIKLLAFGIAKDILKGQHLEMTIPEGATVGDLKTILKKEYPDFQKLVSLSLAVDENYQTDAFALKENQEIVIIPPVSGG